MYVVYTPEHGWEKDWKSGGIFDSWLYIWINLGGFVGETIGYSIYSWIGENTNSTL